MIAVIAAAIRGKIRGHKPVAAKVDDRLVDLSLRIELADADSQRGFLSPDRQAHGHEDM